MIGTLVTHTGAVRVTRTELEAIVPPPVTRSWKPVAHGELIDVLEAELERRGLAVRSEAYAVQREGAMLFGVIDLMWRSTNEFAAAIGLRTANDKTMSLQIAVGFRVFVCDNLVFSGDLIALRRRHTANLDLRREIAHAMDRYQAGVVTLEERITQLKEHTIADSDAKQIIFEAFYRQMMPVRFFGPVSEAYFDPTETPELEPRTRWSLHNAFTRYVRQMPPGPAFQATAELGQLFGLGQQN